MTEDFLVIKETAEGKIICSFPQADELEAKGLAESVCNDSKQVVYVYRLVGIAKPKKVWPIQFTKVPERKRR